jgi:branched-chain amino acid transport system substrate-binding protein
MALSEISRAVDETGSDHTVRLAPRDQGGDIDSAVSSARSLVDDENATCLTGPWSSAAVARAAQDVAIPAKVLEISPVAMADDVAELDDHDLVDSTALPVSAEGEALTTAIERELGGIEGRTVNVAVGNDPGSITIGQDFTKAWQDENGTAGGPIALSPSPSSQASVLTAGNPGAVLLADDPTGFAQLVPALSSDPGWNPASAWGSDQLVSPALPAQVGSRAIQGMRALAPGLPDDDPASAAFADRFRSASPPQVKIEPYAAQEFDATILCYLAAVAAGSTDGQEMADTLIDITAPGGTEYSWQQLPGAIKALEDGEDIDYMGASGPLDMDVHGDPTKGVFDLYRYAPRGLQVVGEVPVEKPNPATP